ncbi:MAG: hypothetical protein GXO70_02035 [Acidobacteria bacterium]|nr:hypothetical protein [Acidobacteriota bacterium]
MNLKRQWPILLLWLVIGAGGTWGLAATEAGKPAPPKPVVNQLSPQEQALFDGVKAGDKEKVKKLIAEGVDVNCRPAPEWETPLFVAIVYGQADMANFLIQNGADIHDGVKRITAANGFVFSLSSPANPFLIALTQRKISIPVLTSLLKAGQDVNEEYHNQITFICRRRISNGRYLKDSGGLALETMKPLDVVLCGYCLQWNTGPGGSGTHNEAAALFLMNHGADCKHTPPTHPSYLARAIRGGYHRVMNLMLEKGILKSMTAEQCSICIGTAVMTSQTDVLRTLHKLGVKFQVPTHSINSNQPPPPGWVPLINVAIQGGNLEAVPLLMDMGVKPPPNEAVSDGAVNSPLNDLVLQALWKGTSRTFYTVLKRLIQYGCDINLSDSSGKYPLGLATAYKSGDEERHLKTMKALLANRANVNGPSIKVPESVMQSLQVLTGLRARFLVPAPLALALRTKSRARVQLLLAHGADTSRKIRDVDGNLRMPSAIADELGITWFKKMVKEFKRNSQ